MAEKEQNVLSVNNDDANLASLGYDPQLKRHFSPFSMLALCVSLMATWEALCSTIATGLASGGPVSLVYGSIVAFFGALSSAASLAELASIWPTAGGQYYFVARLAPQRIRSVSSWTAGYISLLGWLAVAASAPFLAGTMIQALIGLNHPEYVPERWHGTLLYWAILMLATTIAIFGNRMLPLIQQVSMTLHVSLFIVLLVVMCALSPAKQPAKFVFATFINNSGWSNNGVAWCIGLLSPTYVLVGFDGAIHLCEEMHNAAEGVPRAMVGSVFLNSILGFGFMLTILFNMGTIDNALASDTGFPVIQIWQTITGSNRGATAMSCAVVVMASLSTIPLITTAGRTMWAFARDDALPFHTTLVKVEKRHGIPVIATLVCVVVLMLLGLINIGSTAAFNAMLSLAIVGLQVSYMMPITLVFWRRIMYPGTIAWGKWNLGRFGVVANGMAIFYLTLTSLFSLFPPYQPVTPQNMNYSSLVFGAMMLFGLIYYLFCGGKEKYSGPVVALDGIESDEVLPQEPDKATKT